MILALYRAGRQADALAVMQDARASLRDELGLDPSQALQQLEKAILLQDPSLLPEGDRLAGRPRSAPPRIRPTRPAAPAPVCAACSTVNAHGAEFCHACGAPLVADASLETRKTVTVLFCDVVAFTELAGRIDPEALRNVMSRFFELAAATIERHGGTIEKFIGDEVMAVFGVPAVREDDALRAVRAAVELRDAIPALETELAERASRSGSGSTAARSSPATPERATASSPASLSRWASGSSSAPPRAKSCWAKRPTPSSRMRSRRHRSSR